LSTVPLGCFIQLFRIPAICLIVPTGIVLVINYTLHATLFSEDRIVNGCCLAINGTIFAFFYVAGLLRSGYLDGYDIALLRERIPFIKRILSYAN
jgi:hypothetical protein